MSINGMIWCSGNLQHPKFFLASVLQLDRIGSDFVPVTQMGLD